MFSEMGFANGWLGEVETQEDGDLSSVSTFPTFLHKNFIWKIIGKSNSCHLGWKRKLNEKSESENIMYIRSTFKEQEICLELREK